MSGLALLTRTAVLVITSVLASPACAQQCGDCNGDGRVDVLDSLAAAGHSVGLLTLVSPQLDACNVAGVPGAPGIGGAVIDVLDSLELARFAAGLLPTLDCRYVRLSVDTLCPPSLAASSSSTLTPAASGDVTLTFSFEDTAPGTVELTFEHSTDGGRTYRLCSSTGGGSVAANPAIGLPAGAGLTFVWDSAADDVATASPQVVIARVCATSQVTGEVVVRSLELLLENRPGQQAFTPGEMDVIATLRSIARAQERFREGVFVDIDGDGYGEFGWLQELAAVTPHRQDGASLAPVAVRSPLVEEELGLSAVADGLATLRGYHYRVWLPTAIQAASEGSGPPLTSAAAADAQEARWIVYAWPEVQDCERRRAFVVDRLGEPWFTENVVQAYAGRAVQPAADAALSAASGSTPPLSSANLETRISQVLPGGDGQLWQPVVALADEDFAIDVLAMVGAAQAAFRAAVIVDQDADGEGEFGWLQELAAAAAPRLPRQARAAGPVDHAFVLRALGASAARGGGVATLGGYRFRMHLPRAPGGTAAAETVPTPTFPQPGDHDAQEDRWICYAWPAPGSTGTRVMAVVGSSTVGSGVVWQTSNEDRAYGDGGAEPAGGAVFVACPGCQPGNLEGALAPGVPAADGHPWHAVKLSLGERTAIGSLRAIARAQEAWHESAVVDVDCDGAGEHGFLAELSGTVAYPAPQGGLSAAPFEFPQLSSVFGDTASRRGGIATRGGYVYRVYLPRDSGPAQPEPAAATPVATADADPREENWICYAWPLVLGVDRLAFVISQEGAVWSTFNRGAQDYEGLSPAGAPAPGAALVRSHPAQDLGNLDGRLQADQPGEDGFPWQRVARLDIETAAIDTLRRIARAEEEFRARALLDYDQNGSGQYGYLRELAGLALRAPASAWAPLPLRAPLTGTLGTSAIAGGGIAEQDGYAFLVYLPQRYPDPARGEHQITVITDTESAARQHNRFACYAWPVEPGFGRAFVVDARGEVWQNQNQGGQRYAGRTAAAAPRPEAAFIDRWTWHSLPPALDSWFRDDAVALDGSLWTRVPPADGLEAKAIAELRIIAAAQERFRESVTIDADRDFMGEFGYLQELGAGPWRFDSWGPYQAPHPSVLISTTLASSALRDGGVATRGGYHTLVYLPVAAGPAAGETVPMPALQAADADSQEERWVCYAWPEVITTDTRRAFAVTADGQLWATANDGFQGYEGLGLRPSPGAAFDPASPAPDRLQGWVRHGGTAVDGGVWRAVPRPLCRQAAIDMLGEIAGAQEEWRSRGTVDTDGDGRGEFGFLQELAGWSAPRAAGGVAAAPAPGLLPGVLGQTAERDGGIAEWSGWRFRMFLPGGGAPLAEPPTGTPGDPALADAQEERWACYAWPASRRGETLSALVLNQYGEVRSPRTPSRFPYEGLARPVGSGNSALAAGATDLEGLYAAPGSAAQDGETWSPVRRESGRDEAIAALRSIIRGQERFQADGIVDQDGDGDGEAGWLQELAGTGRHRVTLGALSGAPGGVPYVPQSLGESMARDGLATLSSYHVTVFLPSAALAVRETPGPAVFTDPGDSDPQEQRWIAYAWPKRPWLQGYETYVANQHGVIHSTLSTAWVGSGAQVPVAGAALVAGFSQEAERLEGNLQPRWPAFDGWFWPALPEVGGESEVIRTLQQIHAGQERFRAKAIVDQDSDGLGEYGWMQELGGDPTGSRDSFGALTGVAVSPTFIPTALASTAAGNAGIAGKSGYSFRVFVPTATGNARGEASPVPTFPGPPFPDAQPQEQRWICYAWPSHFSDDHRRAFVVNQAGVVYATANANAQNYTGTVALGAPFSPGAALASFGSENADNLEGVLWTGSAARDGRNWYPAR